MPTLEYAQPNQCYCFQIYCIINMQNKVTTSFPRHTVDDNCLFYSKLNANLVPMTAILRPPIRSPVSYLPCMVEIKSRKSNYTQNIRMNRMIKYFLSRLYHDRGDHTLEPSLSQIIFSTELISFVPS